MRRVLGEGILLLAILLGQRIIVIEAAACFVSPCQRPTNFPEHHQGQSESRNMGAAARVSRRTSSISMANDSSSSSSTPNTIVTQEDIVQMIEVSFIQTCLSLSEGYVDVLKLFIAACQAAYHHPQHAMPVTTVIHKVNEIPQRTANRELMPEEVKLRATWIQAVYRMLHEYYYDGDPTVRDDGTSRRLELSPDFQEEYEPYVKPIFHIAASGGSQAMVMNLLSSNTSQQKEALSPVQKAVQSQTLRVMWYTLVVLADENRADPDNLTPNIPGSFQNLK